MDFESSALRKRKARDRAFLKQMQRTLAEDMTDKLNLIREATAQNKKLNSPVKKRVRPEKAESSASGTASSGASEAASSKSKETHTPELTPSPPRSASRSSGPSKPRPRR